MYRMASRGQILQMKVAETICDILEIFIRELGVELSTLIKPEILEVWHKECFNG